MRKLPLYTSILDQDDMYEAYVDVILVVKNGISRQVFYVYM